MILDESAKELLEQFVVANEAETIATKKLLAYLEGGGRDEATLNALTDNMTATHNKKMDLYAQLQALRLDK